MADAESYAPLGPFCLTPEGIKKALIDPLGGMIVIDRNHHEVHEGEFFEFGQTFLLVADDGFAYLRFKTSAAKTLHFGSSITAEGKALVKIYEGTTYTDDGTVITPINNNRCSSDAAETSVWHTPTVDVLGSELTPENGVLLIGGLGPQSVGGSVKGDEEIIAADGTDYLIAVQNVSGQVKDITIQVGGYEEPPC